MSLHKPGYPIVQWKALSHVGSNPQLRRIAFGAPRHHRRQRTLKIHLWISAVGRFKAARGVDSWHQGKNVKKHSPWNWIKLAPYALLRWEDQEKSRHCAHPYQALSNPSFDQRCRTKRNTKTLLKHDTADGWNHATWTTSIHTFDMYISSNSSQFQSFKSKHRIHLHSYSFRLWWVLRKRRMNRRVSKTLPQQPWGSLSLWCWTQYTWIFPAKIRNKKNGQTSKKKNL